MKNLFSIAIIVFALTVSLSTAKAETCDELSEICARHTEIAAGVCDNPMITQARCQSALRIASFSCERAASCHEAEADGFDALIGALELLAKL